MTLTAENISIWASRKVSKFTVTHAVYLSSPWIQKSQAATIMKREVDVHSFFTITSTRIQVITTLWIAGQQLVQWIKLSCLFNWNLTLRETMCHNNKDWTAMLRCLEWWPHLTPTNQKSPKETLSAAAGHSEPMNPWCLSIVARIVLDLHIKNPHSRRNSICCPISRNSTQQGIFLSTACRKTKI